MTRAEVESILGKSKWTFEGASYYLEPKYDDWESPRHFAAVRIAYSSGKVIEKEYTRN
jgi:hypothetical protein